jgi:soluble lytic murein transglycosylase-like protein
MLRYCILLMSLGCAPLASADIYAYVDGAGTTHYSNVPNSRRFKLVAREPRVPAPQAAARFDSTAYTSAVAAAAEEATIDAALVHAVITVESGYNPRAVSARGAQGLMQLMPATAQRYGVADPFDPTENIRAGARYLGHLLARFDGDVELALAAYDAGEEAVARYGNRIPPFDETRLYVPRVMQVLSRMRGAGTGAVPATRYQETLPPT